MVSASLGLASELSKPKPRTFTSPSGRQYVWQKKTPPTQSDIDAMVAYDKSLDTQAQQDPTRFSRGPQPAPSSSVSVKPSSVTAAVTQGLPGYQGTGQGVPQVIQQAAAKQTTPTYSGTTSKQDKRGLSGRTRAQHEEDIKKNPGVMFDPHAMEQTLAQILGPLNNPMMAMPGPLGDLARSFQAVTGHSDPLTGMAPTVSSSVMTPLTMWDDPYQMMLLGFGGPAGKLIGKAAGAVAGKVLPDVGAAVSEGITAGAKDVSGLHPTGLPEAVPTDGVKAPVGVYRPFVNGEGAAPAKAETPKAPEPKQSPSVPSADNAALNPRARDIASKRRDAVMQQLEDFNRRNTLPGDVAGTFTTDGPVRWTAGQQSDWVGLEGKRRFFDDVLAGKDPTKALEDARQFILESNAKHNARYKNAPNNQVFAESGTSSLHDAFYAIRDAVKAGKIGTHEPTNRIEGPTAGVVPRGSTEGTEAGATRHETTTGANGAKPERSGGVPARNEVRDSQAVAGYHNPVHHNNGGLRGGLFVQKEGPYAIHEWQDPKTGEWNYSVMSRAKGEGGGYIWAEARDSGIYSSFDDAAREATRRTDYRVKQGATFKPTSQPQGEAWVRPSAPESPTPQTQVGGETPLQPVQTAKNGKPQTTGLANVKQDAEALDGILAESPKTSGKGARSWQAEGKRAVEAGTDPEVLAHQIGSGEVELTGERVGALLEGKRRLLNAVNSAKSALDEGVKAGGDTKALRESYSAAQERLSTFVENVQQGKGRWSDVGRALQAGTELDTSNFADVLSEFQRRTGKAATSKEAERLQKMVDDANTKIASHEAEIARLKAEGTVQTIATKRAKIATTKAQLAEERTQILTEIGKITGGRLSANPVDLAPELARHVGRLAINLAKEGATTLADVTLAVRQHLKDVLPDLTDEQIHKAMAEYRASEPGTVSEASARALDVKARAKAATQAAGYKAQLEAGDYTLPAKVQKAIDNETANLRAQRDLARKQIQAHIDYAAKSPFTKAVQGVGSTVRGVVLGTDAGQLTRQGLFAWSRPKVAVKAVGEAIKAIGSDVGLQKFENQIADRMTADGRLLAPIRKKAGLSLTDSLTHPEELVTARLLQKIPIVKHIAGKPLERAQLAFINSVRADLFDSAVAQGFSEKELAQRASFINAATGRGNVKQIPDMLSVIMTSPRYEASRWEMIGKAITEPARIVGKGGINKAALANTQDMAVTAAGVFGLFKASELAGYQVDWNPTSADFLKMRRGDETWDVSAGLAPRLRDIMRMYVAATNPEYKMSWKDIAGAATTRTISPAIRLPAEQGAFAYQRSQGQEPKSPFTGYAPGAGDEGLQALWPVIFQSMKQALDAEGPGAAASAGAREFIGGNVNRYPKKN